MNVAAPTDVDLQNARLAAFERQKIVYYNYFCERFPHIFKGNTYLRIRFNRTDPNTEKDPFTKIKVDWCSTESFCRKVHCQKRLPYDKDCEKEDIPQLIKSGNSTLVACQAGCFEPFHEKSEMKGPFTFYSKRQKICLLQVDIFHQMAIDPYLRTTKHPTPRIDTIGTGFDVMKDIDEPYMDDQGNETYKYKINKYYCDDFQMLFDGTKCIESIGELISSIFFSKVLYKAFQYGIRWADTGVGIHGIQKVDTGPVDEKIIPGTIKSWLSDIKSSNYVNPNVTLKDLGMTEDNYQYLIWSTESTSEGQLTISKELYEKTVIPTEHLKGVLVYDYNILNKYRPQHLRYDFSGLKIIDEYEFLNIYKYLTVTPSPDEEDNESQRDLIEIILNILKKIGLYFALPFVTSVIVEKLVLTFISYLEKVGPLLIHKLDLTIMKVAGQVIGAYFRPVVLDALNGLFAFSTRIFASAFKQISFITMIVGLIDLLDVFDLFDKNKLVNEKFVDSYSEYTLAFMKQTFGVSQVELSPIYYVSLLLQNRTNDPTLSDNKFLENTMIKLSVKNDKTFNWTTDTIINNWSDPIEEIIWISEYLYSLKYNSNGLFIDWNNQSLIDLENMNKEYIISQVKLKYEDYMAGQSNKLTELKITFLVSIGILPIILMFNFKLYIFCLFCISTIIIFQIYYPISLIKIFQNAK